LKALRKCLQGSWGGDMSVCLASRQQIVQLWRGLQDT
jgi:hypothetical protein